MPLSTMSFTEAYARCEAEARRYRDVVVPASTIAIEPGSPLAMTVRFQTEKDGDWTSLTVTPDQIAARQIGEYIDMPARYWDKCTAAPDLLAHNVSHWFADDSKPRLLRTIDGRLRAFLSDRYRIIDHIDVMTSVMPELGKPGWRIAEIAISDKRLYITAVSEAVTTEVRPGDIVHAAVTISNSEVGHGALTVEPSLYRASSRTSVIAGTSLRKYHVGRMTDATAQLDAFFSDETRELQDRALMKTIQDVVRGAVDEARFLELAAILRDAAATRIEEKPLECIEITTRRFSLSEAEREALAGNLFRAGDLTNYGLSTAIAAAATEAVDHDRAAELRRMAATVLEDKPRSTQLLAQAS